jgi:hypothetical protein
MINRRSRNRVTNLLRYFKSKYNKELIDENSDNPGNFWKTVKQIMPGPGGKKRQVTNIRINGTLTSDEQEI